MLPYLPRWTPRPGPFGATGKSYAFDSIEVLSSPGRPLITRGRTHDSPFKERRARNMAIVVHPDFPMRPLERAYDDGGGAAAVSRSSSDRASSTTPTSS